MNKNTIKVTILGLVGSFCLFQTMHINAQEDEPSIQYADENRIHDISSYTYEQMMDNFTWIAKDGMNEETNTYEVMNSFSFKANNGIEFYNYGKGSNELSLFVPALGTPSIDNPDSIMINCMLQDVSLFEQKQYRPLRVLSYDYLWEDEKTYIGTSEGYADGVRTFELIHEVGESTLLLYIYVHNADYTNDQMVQYLLNAFNCLSPDNGSPYLQDKAMLVPLVDNQQMIDFDDIKQISRNKKIRYQVKETNTDYDGMIAEIYYDPNVLDGEWEDLQGKNLSVYHALDETKQDFYKVYDGQRGLGIRLFPYDVAFKQEITYNITYFETVFDAIFTQKK